MSTPALHTFTIGRCLGAESQHDAVSAEAAALGFARAQSMYIGTEVNFKVRAPGDVTTYWVAGMDWHGVWAYPRGGPRATPAPKRDSMNINETVIVTLTEAGQAALKQLMANEDTHGGCYAHPHAIKSNGEPHTWQLWELMRVFGPSMDNGGDTLFEGNAITFDPVASPLAAVKNPTPEPRPQTTLAFEAERTRCKAEAAKASGEANAALMLDDILQAERHFCRASRLLVHAMGMTTAIRLAKGGEA